MDTGPESITSTGEAVASRGFWPGIADIRHAIGLRRAQHESKDNLVAALNDVADAVSSAMDIDEVLGVIVERAKIATDTDKAILVLVDEHQAMLDLDTMVVRGSRQQHPQEFWEQRLIQLGGEALSTGDPVIEILPDLDAFMLRVPVRVRDHPIGVICAINSQSRAFTPGQVDFLSILSAFAAAAIENARLAEHDRYLMLSSERNRIAREMHDGVVQSLFSVSLGMEVCKKLAVRDPARAVSRLDELQEHLNSSMSELRRLVYDLRSMRLKSMGLERAIDSWIREVAETGDSPRGQLTVEGTIPAIGQRVEMCLYRLAKESVTNVVKHSQAASFSVRLIGGDGRLALVVEDDGLGFDAAAISDESEAGIGLRSMRERVEREGGRLEIESVLNQGTRVTAEFNGFQET